MKGKLSQKKSDPSVSLRLGHLILGNLKLIISTNMKPYAKRLYPVNLGRTRD
jgi:hypothetical protein